jgi:hypothetical protein
VSVAPVDWDGHAPLPAGERVKAFEAEQWRVDSMFASVFATPQGRQVLAFLRQRTIEQPCWVPGQDAAHGYAREGQNSIVREIEMRIQRAAKGPPASVREKEIET